ncbi:MAG: hypothetical protein CL572_01510 [Alphaproteobacteria bacterium]|nr:hypothetical protein [Alphaproteobacteria bacterium]
MNKYKQSFKKNSAMMILIVTVILIGLLLINYISKKNNLNQSIGGSFLLTDHQGNSFNSKKINLKKLIYFGYTFCPDICPMDMLKISQIFDQNPNLKKKILPIFITVDPSRDNQKILKNFMENFNDAFVGLTGDKNEISTVIKSYKIYVNYNKKNDNDKTYLVDHSSLIFLIDENDQFLALIRPNELSVDKIEKYLKEII